MDAQTCDDELLRKLDAAASPEVSGMLNRYFVAALCESAAARLRFKDAAIDNLAAEVELLRAAMLGVGLAITAYDASADRARSDYDMVCAGGRLYDAVQGIHDSWKLGLDPQPLPAPPKEEEEE